MSMYSTVHAGPNSQSGGLKAGLSELVVPTRYRARRGRAADCRGEEDDAEACEEPEDQRYLHHGAHSRAWFSRDSRMHQYTRRAGGTQTGRVPSLTFGSNWRNIAPRMNEELRAAGQYRHRRRRPARRSSSPPSRRNRQSRWLAADAKPSRRRSGSHGEPSTPASSRPAEKTAERDEPALPGSRARPPA